MSSTPPRSAAAPWKPLVVCPHAGMAQRIVAVLRELGCEELAPIEEYPRLGTVAALAQKSACDIAFLDVASNSGHAQVLIGELAPAMPVVALDPHSDAELILRCLRHGASDFLTDPTAETVRGLFTRLERARTPASQHSTGAVYCVVPGKAGSGASTLAAHLALQLAAGGAAALLVDADPANASVAFLLKLKTEYHLGDVLRDWKRMDGDLWARLTVRARGVDVLGAPESPAVRFEMTPQTAGELCAFWRERYATVVIDLGDARSAVESGLAALADTVLLVGANELASLQATRRSLEYLERTVDRARLRLILNRCAAGVGLKKEDVRGALGLDLFATLANDWTALQAALLEGRTVAATTRFGASVDHLCRQLRNRNVPAEKKNGSWLSLLRHRGKSEIKV